METVPAKKPRLAEAPGANAKLGHIERLVLENFKSYEGLHEIGPFEKFTCIIGPNGAGKSNVMDAISFCLGIKAKHLRGDKLRDLVYRREEEDVQSNTRRASATLVFRTGAGEVLHFGRVINSRGEGSYRYGPPSHIRNVGYDEFLQLLAHQNIFVKARNFLVFQGDVMELARRQGMELTGMLETISGSEQLKESYDKLSRELDIAEERARLHFQHRREVEGMMSLLEKQKSEYEKYQELLKQRDELALQKILFKVCCAENEVVAERNEMEELKDALDTSERKLRLKRKEAEALDADKKLLQQQVDDATAEHASASSMLNKLRELVRKDEGQKVLLAQKLRESEEQGRLEEVKRRGVDEELLRARKARLKGEEELTLLKARPLESELRMSDAQHREFERLVLQVDATNLRTREEVRKVEEQLAASRKDLATDKRELINVEQKQMRSRAVLEGLEEERKGIQALKGSGSATAEKRRVVAALGDELKKFTSFKEELLEEQSKLRYQLDLAKSRKERLEQIEQRQRLADELRDAFPDQVIGRLSEVLMPTQKRFELPLQMAMGIMAEAFVVTTAEAGRRCVQYLKAKRIQQETFLPLDRMVIPNVGPLHLLTAGKKTRRLATVCAQANEKFLERHPSWSAEGRGMIERATNFMLNGTVIVDDLAEAKSTSYKDAKKHGLQPRIVTLQGEVVQPNGNMSVQSASYMAAVEFGGADQLHEIRNNEKKLSQVEVDLEELHDKLHRKEAEYKKVSAEIAEAEDGQANIDSRVQRVNKMQADEEATLKAQHGRSEELKLRITRVGEKVAQLEKKKESLDAELLKMGKKAFAKLNRELGVPDVREVAQREERERQKLKHDIEACEDQVQKLKNEELAAEKRRESTVALKLQELRRNCEQYHKDIKAAEERLQEKSAEAAKFADRCKSAADKLRLADSEREEREQQMRDLRADLQRAKIQAEDSRRKVKKQQDKLRILLIYKYQCLRMMREQSLEVPLEHTEPSALEKLLACDRYELDELPFPDLEAVCDAVQLDYALLPEDRSEVAAATRLYDAKGVEVDFDAQIAEITKELEGMNPNVRADEECAAEAKRLADIQQKATDASSETQRLSREFELVKTERCKRFKQCYDHVEQHLQPFYKELTSYDGNEGGSAYLDLDDSEEPYSGGVTFTACPPGKRFFPMELLSGGERSMASMALLFAMHSYKPPPFMILDEVDAPFDKKNTRSLVDYLQKLNFQSLVISLKDTFFSHSDSIIGIYKDKVAQCSGILTLPLRTLGQAPAPETEVPAAEGEDVN